MSWHGGCLMYRHVEEDEMKVIRRIGLTLSAPAVVKTKV